MQAWRTPTDGSRRGAQTPEKRLAGNHTVNLADQALGWATPTALDAKDRTRFGRGHLALQGQARLWPTPNVPNGGRVNPPGTSTTGQAPDGSKKQIGLDEVAQSWATPSARDWRSGEAGEKTLSRNSRPLNEQAVSSRPARGDDEGWWRYLEGQPYAQPAVRRGADGLACRVDRLRLCGNGVVPLVAAHAWRTLKARFDTDA